MTCVLELVQVSKYFSLAAGYSRLIWASLFNLRESSVRFTFGALENKSSYDEASCSFCGCVGQNHRSNKSSSHISSRPGWIPRTSGWRYWINISQCIEVLVPGLVFWAYGIPLLTLSCGWKLLLSAPIVPKRLDYFHTLLQKVIDIVERSF